MPVDILGLEVGYRLMPLVDRGQDGELLQRIKAIRKKFAQDIGFLPPAVHIRDNLELRPAAYRILLKGVEIAHHEAHAGMFLAINPGRVVNELPGIATTDPAFGLPAVWIEADARNAAQAAGYTVVDASTVIATHLSQILSTHAAELLGRQELQQLLDHLTREDPEADRRPRAQGAAARDAAESAAEPAGRRRAHPRHAHDRRSARRRRGAHAGPERAHRAGAHRAGPRDRAADVPGQRRDAGDGARPGARAHAAAGRARSNRRSSSRSSPSSSCTARARAAEKQEQFGLPALLLVPAPLRVLLSRFLRRAIPQLKVMSHAEIPDTRAIKVVSIVGNHDENAHFFGATSREVLTK